MRVESRNGCPICHSRISGNKELGYLCAKCQLIFPDDRLPPKKSRRGISEEFGEHKPFVRSATGVTYHLPDCKYAKRIQDPVEMSREETRDLRACSCTRKA